MAKTHNPRFVALTDAARGRIAETTVERVKQLLDTGADFVLIDVREESEWASSRIPGAIHIGKGVIERDIETVVPDTNTPIVLYCGGGFRSAIASESISAMGYSHVQSMDGGISGWSDAGHAIDEEAL